MSRPEHRHSLPGGPQPFYTTPHAAHQYYVQQVQPNPNALYEQWRQTKVSELEDVVRNALVHWVKQLADMIEAKNAALNQGIMDTQSVLASSFESISGSLESCRDGLSAQIRDVREEGQAAEMQQQAQHNVQMLNEEVRQWRTDQEQLLRGLAERVEQNEKKTQLLHEAILKELQKSTAKDEMYASLDTAQDKICAVLANQEKIFRLFVATDEKEDRPKRTTRSQTRKDSGDELPTMLPPIFQGAAGLLLKMVNSQFSATATDKMVSVKEEKGTWRKRRRRS